MNRERIVNRFDTVSFYLFLLLIFFLPISTALFEIFSSLIITSFFLKRIVLFNVLKTNRTRKRAWDVFLPIANPLRLAVAIFVYVNFLSVLASQFPMLSIKGFIGKTLEAVLLFFAFLETIKNRNQLAIFSGVLIFASALTSVDAIWQALFGKDFMLGRLYTTDHRATATFKHPNDLGSYLVIGVLFIFSLLLEAWPLNKKDKVNIYPVAWRPWVAGGLILAFLLSSVGLGLTYSRGAWVGFFAGLILMTISNRKKFWIPLLAGLFFYLTFNGFLNYYRNASLVTDDIAESVRFQQARIKQETLPQYQGYNIKDIPVTKEEFSNPKKETNFYKRWQDFLWSLSRFSGTGRSVFWQEALSVFSSAPLLGTGLNTYNEVVQKYKITWGQYPHNCYLQMAAETGILGLGSFLWILFLLFRQAWITLHQDKNKSKKAFVAAGLFGLTGFLVHGALDTNFYSVNLGNYMWLMMGFVVSALNLTKPASSV